VIAACLWNNPQVRRPDLIFVLLNICFQICVLDEPSNFLDREALGGLAVAIKEWSGAVVSIFLAPILILRSLTLLRLSYLTTTNLFPRCVSCRLDRILFLGLNHS